jgi:hypothetical protein
MKRHPTLRVLNFCIWPPPKRKDRRRPLGSADLLTEHDAGAVIRAAAKQLVPIGPWDAKRSAPLLKAQPADANCVRCSASCRAK